MVSIQRFARRANNLGTCIHTEQQVINDGGALKIVPADPQVIYVPVSTGQVVSKAIMARPFYLRLGWPIGLWLKLRF